MSQRKRRAGIVGLGLAATPTFLHVPMTLQALQAGKHVHCEKPFCRSVAEGMQAVEMATSTGCKVVVGETYVFTTAHMRARALVEAGEIGRPLQVRQRHGAWLERPRARVGAPVCRPVPGIPAAVKEA